MLQQLFCLFPLLDGAKEGVRERFSYWNNFNIVGEDFRVIKSFKFSLF